MEALMSPTQDMVLGLYWITREREDEERKIFPISLMCPLPMNMDKSTSMPRSKSGLDVMLQKLRLVEPAFTCDTGRGSFQINQSTSEEETDDPID